MCAITRACAACACMQRRQRVRARGARVPDAGCVLRSEAHRQRHVDVRRRRSRRRRQRSRAASANGTLRNQHSRCAVRTRGRRRVARGVSEGRAIGVTRTAPERQHRQRVGLTLWQREMGVVRHCRVRQLRLVALLLPLAVLHLDKFGQPTVRTSSIASKAATRAGRIALLAASEFRYCLRSGSAGFLMPPMRRSCSAAARKDRM